MLCDAIEGNDLDEVTRLLEAGANVDQIDFEHEATPLEKAAEERHAPAVELLLDAGATPDRAMISPALLIAATNGDADIAALLLEAGASPDEPNEDGVTPLMGAAMSGHKPLVELLLASGADPRQRARDGDNAHFVAANDEIRALLPPE